MPNVPLINTRVQFTQFDRKDGFSLQTGVAVGYALRGYSFQIIATRHGVQVLGMMPIVKREGIQLLNEAIRRSLRQHEHLASFPEGTKQAALSEETLDAEQRVAMMESVTKVM